MVTLESLVPADHLVRKIAAAIELEFIRERVAHLYCPDSGRPALDPVLLFKLLLLEYLFGIGSERQLIREVQVNVAYRWMGYPHTDPPCGLRGARALHPERESHQVVVRHVWKAAKEAVDARRLTEWDKRVYARRKETVERSFADAKQLHGHRYARMGGLSKVLEQCLLATTAQNMKKIALLLARFLCLWLHGTLAYRLSITA